MFSKLSSKEIKDFIPFFQSKPKFALFANAAKFQVENRIPNHPCDFYFMESNGSKYFYVFRHNKIPDPHRPILMIGNDGIVNPDDVIFGLEQIKLLEPNLGNIEMLIANSEISPSARKFFVANYDREDYNNPCFNFYLPSSVATEVQEKVNNFKIPPGFSIGSTQVSDVKIVNSTWKFATEETVLQMREFILRLPTTCISYNGKPVSFEMIGLHGQLNHHFTFPEYRNQGLGGIVEYTLVSKCFREGIQVVKSVETTNEAVVKRSLNHNLWKIVEDDNGETIVFDYTHYH